jgi:hypothetical protein
MDCVKHVYASKEDVRNRCLVVVAVAGVLAKRVHWRDEFHNSGNKVDRPWQAAVFEEPHSTDQVQDVPLNIL